MKVKTGSYTGNGTSQSITGIGFRPDCVIIKRPANNINAVIHISTMTANETKDMFAVAVPFSGGITSLGADGFSVGSDSRVNNNSSTHYYVAFSAGEGDCAVGTYAGNATDDRDITTGLTDHDLVIVVSESSIAKPWWRTTDMSGDMSFGFGDASSSTNQIQSQTAGVFQVGTGNDVNLNAVDHHWIALKNATATLKVFTYVGDGLDDRSITGVGFEPTFAFTKRAGSSTGGFNRFGAQVGDASQAWNWSTETNRIQAFEADGIQVGTADNVNASGATYYAAAFRDGTTALAALTGTAVPSIGETEIVAGGETIIITLENDTWVTAGASFNSIRQDIINGLDSAQAEAAGWNAEVRDKQGVAGVVRTSDNRVTITLDAQAAYNITAQETITCTVPASAVSSGVVSIATPVFTAEPSFPARPPRPTIARQAAQRAATR